jgi:hypothetical protein
MSRRASLRSLVPVFAALALVLGLATPSLTANAEPTGSTARSPGLPRPIAGVGGITARCCFGMAYDALHNSTVLFGGCCDASGNFLNETWVWNGTTWTQLSPASSPCPRNSTRILWDGHQIILFGGLGGPTCPSPNVLQRDTWLWNGTNWIQCAPPAGCSTGQPGARESEGMALDQSTDATADDVIMFGGNGNPPASPSAPDEMQPAAAPLNDTWIWDGTAKTWTQLFPTTSPCTRNSAGMAFDADPARNKVWLFGGQGGSNCPGGAGPLNDNWSWNGSKWVKCADAVCNPNGLSKRTGHRVAWDADSAIQRIVLFGGDSQTTTSSCPAPSNTCNDTWNIDGGPWTQQTPVHPPSVRCCGGLAYEALNNRLVLFGGAGPSQVNKDDTWLWNGTDWCQVGATC